MDDISEDLKRHILGEWNKVKDEALAAVRKVPADTRYIILPFYVCGVVDMARYDRIEDRFDRLEVQVGIGRGYDNWDEFHMPFTAHFDGVRTVYIYL